MKLWAIIMLTVRESLAKKTFLAFFCVSTLVALLFIFALNLDIVDGLKSSVSLFGRHAGEVPDLKNLVYEIQGGIILLLFTGGIFMSLFATSSLVPSMIQPGLIDLYISKPVSRLVLLSGRILGAQVIVVLNVFYLIISTWMIMSIKSGIWNWNFLLSGAVIIVLFSVLYTFMALFGVLTNSASVSLMVTYAIIFFSPLLLQRNEIYALLSSRTYGLIFDGIYYALPKIAELGMMTQRITRGLAPTSFAPLWTTMAFGLVSFALAGWIFQRKNF